MLPGLSGELLPASFTDRALDDIFRSQAGRPDRFRDLRRLARGWRRAHRMLGPASSPRAVLDIAILPLLEALGYTIARLEPRPPGFAGVLGPPGAPLAVLLALPWAAVPDSAWRDLVRSGRTAGARWGLVSNGATLSLVDATRPWNRRTIRFDLQATFEDERSAQALSALLRADALAPGADGRCLLDGVIARSDRQTASLCSALGDGVLRALGSVISVLAGPTAAGRPPAPALVFEQSLTLVYRVLFLLFAEARGLVPTWHRVYRDAYTIGAMCRRLESRQGEAGLGETLSAIARLAHAGCRAGTLTVTAFNGRLFSPRQSPLADRRALPDSVARDLVLALATTATPAGPRRVAYGDLGVEQLGAVYERVLEYEPDLSVPGSARLTRTAIERKTTGSFYTPLPMTRFLVRRALAPLVAGRTADQILALRIVDPAMGSGAFLVAACEYLAGACEHARLASGEWRAGDVTPADRATLYREIAHRCLYGVDVSPMAVQLARLSLWLTTLATDRPLTFLDHHVATGDSLLGASLTDLARRPDPGRRRAGRHGTLPLLDLDEAGQVVSAVLPDRYRLATEPSDTLDAVRDKERRLDALSAPGSPLGRWKAAADVWTAAWLGALPESRTLPGELIAHALGRPVTLGARDAAVLSARAAAAAAARRPLHWELEFPEVFFDADGRRRADGGFDAVIGNPPWEMMRADTGAGEQRAASRRACRDGVAFARESGIFRLQGGGQVNRYQLFVERALQIARPGARLGLILPSGFAIDHGSRTLRRAVLDRTRVETITGFDNRAGIFPIHRSIRFLLLVATAGGRTDRFRASSGLTDPDVLDRWPDLAADDPPEARRLSIACRQLESWDPVALTIPDLASAMDLSILDRAVRRVPRLGSEAGWAAHFGRELNATDDRRHLVPHSAADDSALPIVEGKQLEPFRADISRATLAIPEAAAARLLDAGRTFERDRLAYRDVAGAGNRLTLIAAWLPAGTVSTHTVFCLKTLMHPEDGACLLALLNSLVANYLVRLRVSTHVTSALMSNLPVPRPRKGSATHRRLAALADELARTGLDAAHPAYAELNAIAAGLYGLTRAQYAHVVGTFPLLPRELRQRCTDLYERKPS